MILYTAQYRVHDIDRLDITRGGCDRAYREGKPAPGAIFAPSKELLRRGLAERAAACGNEEDARAAWEAYAFLYRAEMRDSYRRHREAWENFLRRERLVLVCFCAGEDAAARRCHRFLLASFWTSPKLGTLAADYRGELTEADRIAPPPGVQAPPELLFGATSASGRSTRFMFTDGTGGGIITHDRARRRRCKTCGAEAALLCDFPTGKRRKKTCDAPICGTCARTVGPDRHFCPAHSAGAAEGARP
jgi:hypothetical protein